MKKGYLYGYMEPKYLKDEIKNRITRMGDDDVTLEQQNLIISELKNRD